MSELSRQWSAVQAVLRGQMTRATADHLLGGATLVETASGPGCWTVRVRHPAARAWLASPRWAGRVAEAVAQVTGRTTQVRFIVYTDSQGVGEEPLPPPEGDCAMQHDKRVRVISHMTRSAFLHVEDALSIGKLRLFAGSYRKGQGAEALLVHYLDVADARVVLRALADAVPGYQYREYKGGTLAGGRAVSRVLTVQAREEKLFVELARGPGTLTATGAVTPSRVADPTLPHETVTVVFSLHQAQRLAEEALAYLGAWDLVRMQHYQAELGVLPGYVLTGEEVGVLTGAGEVEEEGLCYGDGSEVDLANAREVAAWWAFQRAEQGVPASREVLRQWAQASA